MVFWFIFGGIGLLDRFDRFIICCLFLFDFFEFNGEIDCFIE